MSTYNAHSLGTSVDVFNSFSNLSEFFHILSTSYDTGRKLMVSAMEGKKYPIFGTQFHPEKELYNPGPYPNLSRNSIARELAENLIFNFMDVARMNNHKYKDPIEEERD
jgi:gamma-glutamyl hydrolase